MASKTTTQTADIIAAIIASDSAHESQAVTALDGHIAAQLKATNVIAPIFKVRNEAHIASQTGAVAKRKSLSMPAFIAGLKRDAENDGTEWKIKDYKVSRAVLFAAHDALAKTAFLARCKREDELATWSAYVTFVNGWGKGWFNADGTQSAKGKREANAPGQGAERKNRDLGTGDHVSAIVEDEEFKGESDEETLINVGRWLRMVEHDVKRQVAEWFADNVVAGSDVDEAIKAAVSKVIRDAKSA